MATSTSSKKRSVDDCSPLHGASPSTSDSDYHDDDDDDDGNGRGVKQLTWYFDDNESCICNHARGDNPMCLIHDYIGPSASASAATAATPSANSDISDLSSSVRNDSSSRSKKKGSVLPAEKRNKSFHSVDTMLSIAASSLKSAHDYRNEIDLSNDDDDDDNVEVQYQLIKPNSAWPAKCWQHFKVYHERHKDKKDIAVCSICGTDISYKGPTTTGLNKHLKFIHHKVYAEMNKQKGACSNGSSSTQSITGFLGRKISVEDLKKQLIYRATNWVIDKCVPFTMLESPSFRAMFLPFHAAAHKITTISADRIREEIFNLGTLAKEAADIELALHMGSWTSDHWTGNDDATYTTTTFHTIKNWKLCSIVVDFKVFHGTTTGEAIYNDQLQVLEGCTTKENIVIGITDTTASMGVLGMFLRNNGMQHAYCTDHNLQCNAVLAFNGKYLTLKVVLYWDTNT